MNANELECLKPAGGLILTEIAETGQAVLAIETAHADLMKTYADVLRLNKARRERQALGVSIPDCELADWEAFKSGPLRRFHTMCEKSAGRVQAILDERLKTEAAEIHEREAGIARGLGGLMHDNQAGTDLALMLKRLTGGLPVDGRLSDCRNAWDSVLRTSTRLLKELPPAPVHIVTNIEKTDELRKLMETRKEE